MLFDNMVDFSEMKGQTLTNVEVDWPDKITFTTKEGNKYVMHHIQDCCESVTIEDICGDLNNLVGSPILQAEEVTNRDETPEGLPEPEFGDESFTWTFYKLANVKDNVTIRWYGESNGCYSEDVDFEKVNDNGN